MTPRPLVVRLAASVALAMFGAQAWGDMVRPEAPGRLVAAALLGGLLGAAALRVPLLAPRARGLALAGIGAGAVLLAVLLAGVEARMLQPSRWDDLLSGLGGGVAALPGLSVPYRGVDEFNRVAMLLGGTLLAIAGPLLATWPGRGGRTGGPGVPAVMLSVLYAVPAIQLTADHPFAEGAVFALLLAAVLFGERLEPAGARIAVPVVVVAAILGVLVAPRLDADEPWVDYEALAQSIGERGTTAFSWNHSYGPLDWPRDGREVLRIRSPRSAYWKATTLGDFDGVRWREVRPQGLEDDPAAETPDPQWIQPMRVSVRNLRTNQFITAGTTLRVERSPRTVEPGAPGSFIVGDEPLRRGHAYLARVYNPRPRAAALESTSSDYPTSLWPYLSMQLPASVGGPPPIGTLGGVPDSGRDHPFIVFPEFASAAPTLGYRERGNGSRIGERWVEQSAYGRAFALARRLAGQSAGPYDYVRRVQAYLQRGFTYTETPPQRPVPLDAFLFRDKVGYCQQFSGAMALLLRMGGVPARVATGFSPGTRDRDRGEYVVRDLDAHSWVEAYFPEFGWLTFDPTPSIAPPRAQASGVQSAESDEAVEDETGTAAGDRSSDPRGIDAGAASFEGDGGSPFPYVGLGLLALLLLGSAGAYVLSHRRHAAMTVDDRVAELERALRRSGRAPQAGLTLQGLEARLRGVPDAAAYVRALRGGRYGFAAESPTRRQRGAVRRALSAGLGVRGRLRSLWALPPW